MPQILFPNAGEAEAAPFTGDIFAVSQNLAKSREDIARNKEQAKVAQEALSLHLNKLQERANALNAVAPVEVPYTTEQGTGASVALETPLPLRNPAEGGLMPLDQPGALVARGYLTEDGKSTPSGKLFLELHKQGLFDDKGLMTTKGKAFLAPADVREQDLDTYAIRDKAGLNDTPEGPDLVDTVWNLGAGIIKGGSRLIRRAAFGEYANKITSLTDAEAAMKDAEDVISNQEALKQIIGSSAQLGSGAGAMIAKGTAKILGDDWEYYAAKQSHDKFKADFQDISTGELYGSLLDSKALTDSLEGANEAAAATMTPERKTQLEQEGGIAGGVLLDPTNLLTMGIGSAVAKGSLALSLSSKAEKATIATLEAQDLAMKAAQARAVLTKTQAAAAIAAKQADNFANIGNLERANTVRVFAAKMAAKADEASAVLAPLEAKAAEKATFAAKMADQAGGATAIMESVALLKDVGRKVRAAPARAAAPIIEIIGNTMIRLDERIASALERVGFNQKTIAGARAVAATAGVTTGLGPLGFVPAALAAGPVVRSVGNFSRVVGNELLAARGSVPFWQRVSQNSTLSPVGRASARLMDTVTLGGKVFDPVRRAATIAKGVAVAAPVDIGFEAIAEGGELNANTIKQGLAESILFAGGAAAANGIVSGKIQDLRAKAAGDEINFRSQLEPDQLRRFSMLPKGVRKNVAIYNAVFPSLNVQFREGGGGAYDRRSNTAIIDTTSPDSLRPLVAHEVNHHIQIKSQMEDGIAAALVGDGVTGGMLRTADGKLDPNFAKAMQAYNDRMIAERQEPLDAREFAIEYFNEATVDDLVAQTESGELQRVAGRSDFERIVRGLVRTTISKAPIIRDLSLKLGGAIDASGRMVQGNGLLADGVREMPFAKKMLRDAIREQAGRPMTRLADETKAPAVTIPAEALRNNPAIVGTFTSALKTDKEGIPVLDSDGMPSYIDRETEMKRALSGIMMEEITRAKIERGDMLPPGELAPQEDGTYRGTHFSDEHITKLRDSGNWNMKQISSLRMFNASAKKFDGATFLVPYQPAIKRNQLGKKVYDGLAMTLRDVVPLAVSTSKYNPLKRTGGNILIHFFSVTQFRENVKNRAASKRGKLLFQGNEVAINTDAEAAMNLHKQGLTTDAYFAEKYGPQMGPEYQNFINSVFGLLTKSQKDINPIFEADKITEREGVYKTYRLDRINQTTRLDGTPLPFVYDAAKQNKMPPEIRYNLFPNGVPEAQGNYFPLGIPGGDETTYQIFHPEKLETSP